MQGLIKLFALGLVAVLTLNLLAMPQQTTTWAEIQPITTPTMEDTLNRFPQTAANEGTPLQRGDAGNVLRVGIASTMPMSGVLGGGVFATHDLDTRMGQFAGLQWSIFSANDSLAFGNTGIAAYTVNIDQLYMHITMQEDVLWHDGVPLTLDDLVFAYEIIAHPDYWGIRWNFPVQTIRGIWDYHLGYADYISGLVLSENGRELTIYFDQMPPSHMHFGIWSVPVPRHAFKGIEVADMVDSLPVRANPIGWGPFRITSIVPGEAVLFEAFDDFFAGAPLLDGIITEIIDGSLVPYAMAAGHFDVVDFPVASFWDSVGHGNYQLISGIAGNYTYIAFRLGYWDTEQNRNVPDPNRPTSDVRLRHAMAYAINQEFINELLFDGLRFPATSIIPPTHSALQDDSLQGFPYNPERARQLLDEAGFTEIDEYGFRKNQAGEPMTLIFAINDAGVNDLVAMFKMDDWAAVGIRVELYEGRMQDFITMIDKMTNDSDNGVVDLMFGGWVPGFNPNPYGRWGATSQVNRSRFTSPRLEQTFDSLSSMDMWDEEFAREQYLEIQRLFEYYSPAILNNWRVNLTAVNNRVTGFTTIVSDETTPFGNMQNWHLVGVTAPAPYSSTFATAFSPIPSTTLSATAMELLGEWRWQDDGHFYIYFSEDDTGHRNWIKGDQLQYFFWWVSGNNLMKDIFTGTGSQSPDDWAFTLNDNTLTITNFNTGIQFVYIRQ
ncbi:MAG: ABC transporter substrate-binding protein [Defluviitaleaceae bacterium]|nr:ABC transporter substrate-binding protein [Defluviitaleaceae bacterium]